MIDQMYSFTNGLAICLLVFLAVPLTMTIVRLLSGPGYADRFVALDMLTATGVAIAALTCVVTRRREFLDVAFGLALFGFIGTCALAAFLERKGGTRS